LPFYQPSKCLKKARTDTLSFSQLVISAHVSACNDAFGRISAIQNSAASGDIRLPAMNMVSSLARYGATGDPNSGMTGGVTAGVAVAIVCPGCCAVQWRWTGTALWAVGGPVALVRAESGANRVCFTNSPRARAQQTCTAAAVDWAGVQVVGPGLVFLPVTIPAAVRVAVNSSKEVVKT
jgi:hypothetical protein